MGYLYIPEEPITYRAKIVHRNEDEIIGKFYDENGQRLKFSFEVEEGEMSFRSGQEYNITMYENGNLKFVEIH